MKSPDYRNEYFPSIFSQPRSCLKTGVGGSILIILMLLSTGAGGRTVSAQTPELIYDRQFRTDAQMAIDSLYNHNTEGADRILAPWKKSLPSHPIWTLWEGMELWWQVLGDLNDESRDEEFFHKMQQADHEAGELLRKERDHPDALIIRAVANGYIARHYSNRESWLTSMNAGRRAYQAHQRLMEVYPDLPDNDFAEGMKLYYSAYLPEAYPVVRTVSWFLPDGDKAEGIKKLEKASVEGVFARPEAGYFLGVILLNYEQHYDEARVYFKNLVLKYPDNSYYRRLYIRTLVQLHEYDLVLREANAAMDYWQKNSLGNKEILKEELMYWKGRALFHAGRSEEALNAFTNALETGRHLPNPENRELHTLSAYYAGRVSENLGQNENAREYYEIAVRQKAGENAKEKAESRLQAL